MIQESSVALYSPPVESRQRISKIPLPVQSRSISHGPAPGQLLNISSLANECGISRTTASSWISILEASYIVFFLRPHHKNFNKRLMKMPKLYFYYTGLAAYLVFFPANAGGIATGFIRLNRGNRVQHSLQIGSIPRLPDYVFLLLFNLSISFSISFKLCSRANCFCSSIYFSNS